MASPGNQHCADCNGTVSFRIGGYKPSCVARPSLLFWVSDAGPKLGAQSAESGGGVLGKKATSPGQSGAFRGARRPSPGTCWGLSSGECMTPLPLNLPMCEHDAQLELGRHSLSTAIVRNFRQHLWAWWRVMQRQTRCVVAEPR